MKSAVLHLELNVPDSAERIVRQIDRADIETLVFGEI